MFIGHFAVAFAAKRVAPRASLGTLMLATSLVDLVWPILLILGLEHVRIEPGNTAFTPLRFTDYPITHSIPGALFWAAFLAGAWYWRHRLPRPALVIGAAVLSHWVLDAVSHGPDVPVLPGGPYVGLGLWNSVAATLIVEGLIFAAAVAWYARTTRARDRVGTWSLAGLVVFLTVVYLLNVFAPPPPNERLLAYGALVAWLLVPWPYWIDRHREVADSSSSR
ncbi:MAG TPA: hypothetical protein VK886_16765 [Vicinamibacterales bacterium]|nr:hypothetical protein [Vicinamibacterales bacterium]